MGKFDLHNIIDGAVRAALSDWRSGVVDFQPGLDPTPARIRAYFDAAGWAWYLEPSGGEYTEKTLDGYQEWCGLAVANWLSRAGDYMADDRCLNAGLKPSLAYYVLPGTSRILGDGKWAEAGLDPARIRRPDPADIRRGDVVVTANNEGRPSHIVLALGAPGPDGRFETVEGNAYGDLGGGVYGEGVVRLRRAELRRPDGRPKEIRPRSTDEVVGVARPTLEWFNTGNIT